MHIITSTSFRIRIFVLLVIVFLSVGFVQAQWQYPNTNLIYYNASPGPGFVGIGTQTPASILEVVGSGCCNIANFRTTSSGNAWLQVGNSVGHMNVGFGSATPHAYLWSSTDSLFIGNDGAPTLFVQGMTNGNVGIGTTDTYGYKFAVNGSAIFTKVAVKPYGSWADYVFNTEYRLRPLRDVDQYIQQNHHLPDMPSADSVAKNGLDLGDNQAQLLKKIEELTLYAIQQQQQIETQNKEMREMRAEMEILKKSIKNK